MMNTKIRICHVFVGVICAVLLTRAVADESRPDRKAKEKAVKDAAAEKGKKQETKKDSTPDSTGEKGKKEKAEQETAADASVEGKTFDKSMDGFIDGLVAPTKNIKIGPTTLTFSGELRHRYEHRYNYDMNHRTGDGDGFNLFRARLNADWEIANFLAARIQVQDAEVTDFRRRPDPSALEDQLDIRELYLDIRPLGDKTLTFRGGRQELSYGDQRLVGGFWWSNVARSFDAVRMIYDVKDIRFDLFASRVVVPHDEHANWPVGGDHLYGSYLTWKTFPFGVADLYYFWRKNKGDTVRGSDGVLGDLQTHTIGVRFKGEIIDNLDYSAEFARQYGQWGTDGHEAYALSSTLGYTVACLPMDPRFGIGYYRGSGDNDPTDDLHETFDNLYPTNHLHYGYIDFFSWRNIDDFAFYFDIKPTKKLNAGVAFHMFHRDQRSDAWYNAGGRVVRADPMGVASTDIGEEIDVTLKYKFSKHITFLTGYSHFFPGKFASDTGTDGGIDWFFVQTVLKF